MVLLAEVRHNLALLATMSDDGSQDEPGLRWLASNLESSALEQTMLPGKASSAFRSQLSKLVIPKEDEVDSSDGLDVVSTLHERISALRKLARVTGDSRGIVAIRFRVRLSNLRSVLKDARQALDSSKGVAPGDLVRKSQRSGPCLRAFRNLDNEASSLQSTRMRDGETA